MYAEMEEECGDQAWFHTNEKLSQFSVPRRQADIAIKEPSKCCRSVSVQVARRGVVIWTWEEGDKRRDRAGSGTQSSQSFATANRLLTFGKPAKSEICFQLTP